MNCILCCVFYQEKYIEMFLILLKSIINYGQLDNNTEILLYTSTNFMEKIKQNSIFDSEKIKFEINDKYNSVFEASAARLDVFSFNCIKNYSKILYLDTDVIIKENINKVFDICKEDVVYALEEGSIDKYTDHGQTLFKDKDEINSYKDKSGFSAGVLLFNNCVIIKDLFDEIKKDIIKRPNNFPCLEQPYIVYNCFKHKLYNNKDFKKYVVITSGNEDDITSDKVVFHFAGGPGNYNHKLIKMLKFLESLNKTRPNL
jgi:lipopolysaccharide biosynthesis glycosyltransferase